MICFLKARPVCYRSVQPFPPAYFRQKISFNIKLGIAGRYLLRQGLFYPRLFFMGTDSPGAAVERSRNSINEVPACTSIIEEKQTLLSKTRENLQSKTAARIYIEIRLKLIKMRSHHTKIIKLNNFSFIRTNRY